MNAAARDYRLGVALVLIATAVFSLKSIFVKFAFQYGIDIVTLLTLRLVFSAPVYGLMALRHLRRASARPGRAVWLQVFLLGVSGYYVAALLDIAGLQYITAGLERLILYLYPSLVVLMSMLVFGRRASTGELLCLLLAYIGLGLVFATDLKLYEQHSVTLWAGFSLPQVVWGGILVFGSAFFFAIYIVGAERMMHTLSPALFTSVAILAATVGVVLHFLVTRPPAILFQWPWQLYALALALAILCTIVPTYLTAEGIKRTSAARASILGSLGPVMTMFFGVWLLGEAVTAWHLLGLAIVLASAVLLGRLKPGV